MPTWIGFPAIIGRIQRGFYLQAVVKEQLGQIEQAEEAARKYLGPAPNDLAGYKVLARIQFAKHKPDQVIETLAKVTAIRQGRRRSSMICSGAPTRRPDAAPEAMEAFQKAEALAPNDVGVQTRLASVRMGMGDVDTAMGDLEHTLKLAPKLPAVGEALFFAALATGDMQKAGDALAKIRAAQGQTEVVGNLEGLFKLAQIDFAGAKAIFADLVQKYPDFTPARINLARVDIMLGDKAAAEKILTDVLGQAADCRTGDVDDGVGLRPIEPAAEATALLERAHRAEPAQTRLTASLGDLYIRAGVAAKGAGTRGGREGADRGLDRHPQPEGRGLSGAWARRRKRGARTRKS